jgi:DNA-binding beta-propeller fold protein YncE
MRSEDTTMSVTSSITRRSLLLVTLAWGLTVAPPAGAQIAVSSNDNKQVLVDGVGTVVRNPAPDTATIIDLGVFPPKVLAEIEVPGSVVGPPMSVAITPDEGLALITAAMKIDPADPTKTAPDNRVSVVDLKASPPRVIATLEAGRSPAGVSINRQGTLALVANRGEGTVSVFGISGKTLTGLGKVTIADEKSGTSHVAIAPDGKSALVTRDADHTLTLLSIDGTKVELAKRDIRAGLRPYGLDIGKSGAVAVVANIGLGGGDADTISVIDMQAKPPRVVETITVGQTPEGIKLSPDGTLCAVVVMNGSNKPKASPFFADAGKLILFRVNGTRLTRLAEAPIGHWSQGAAFSADNKTILVGNMVEKELQVLRLDGDRLTDSGQRIKVKGGPATIRTADK